MKILVVSDTHGYNTNLFKLLEQIKPIDMLIHCGDSGDLADYIEDFMWSASSMNLRLHRYIISAEARWRMPSCWCLILEGERSMCH